MTAADEAGRSALGPGPEFDRIRQITARLGGIARGVGDDCALVPEGPGRLVVSVDLSVEGTHFRREWLSLEEIGWRAAAAALSDLAAAGARAVGVLASLGVPSAARGEDPAAVMAGVGAAAESVGAVVLGGDLTRGERWVLDVVVLGRAESPVTRRGAGPGDGVWVTGALGGARAALARWRAGQAPASDAREAFAHPVPRIAMGQALAAAGARAMLDLSDGLGGDAGHLAAASGVEVAIELDRVPCAPSVAAAAAAAGMAPGEFAARGGEDYELLAALPAGFGRADADRLRAATGVPLTRIGECRSGEGVRFTLEGKVMTLAGFDHFA